MKKKTPLVIAAVALVTANLAVAHPHFSRSVEAKVSQAVSVKVQHFTVPYNAQHLASVSDGFLFHCGNASLTVSGGSLKVGMKELPAGDYIVRARARDADNWTLLVVSKADAGDPSNPDLSKAVELPTSTLTGQSESHHLDVNLYAGHGSTDGKLIIAVGFGPRTVEGAVSF